MNRQALLDFVQELLWRPRSTSPERAGELFRKLPGRDVFVPRLTGWLEENRLAFPEPIKAENIDSLYDPGIDVLLSGTHSGAQVGFQVKSDNDLRSNDFTLRLKAQIQDAHRTTGVELIVVVFACAPTKQNLGKIKWWQNYAVTPSRPQILCLLPERVAGLYERFDFPIEPISLPERTWAGFFQTIGKPNLASFYLDTWPDLPPDQRFLPPEAFGSIRESVKQNLLTFLVGSPAAGKTFTSLQLLWEAFQEGRTVHWFTAADAEPTDGPIPTTALGLVEKTELKRRVDGLLRTLGSPRDGLDIVSRFLVPGALVYIEDPFGKSEEEYVWSESRQLRLL